MEIGVLVKGKQSGEAEKPSMRPAELALMIVYGHCLNVRKKCE
jgi:hypothetical protein